MSSYDSRQSINPNFIDDRRVINNSASLRITVNNNNNNRNNNSNENNNDYQYSPEYRLSDYELNGDEEQYYEEEEDDDKEEEVINNLQTVRRNKREVFDFELSFFFCLK